MLATGYAYLDLKRSDITLHAHSNLAAQLQVRHYAWLLGTHSKIPTLVNGNYSLAHTILLISSPDCVSKRNHNIENTNATMHTLEVGYNLTLYLRISVYRAINRSENIINSNLTGPRERLCVQRFLVLERNRKL